MMSDKKTQVKKIFDNIAGRYDFLNHFLSFGLDFYWRKKALKLTGLNSDSILLDVACGTGDVAIQAKKMGVQQIYGADFSYNMLNLFDKKSDWIDGKLVQMVAEKIPFKDESVTNITVAFGVRNFYDIQEGFNSFYRILRPNGKATVIEFRMPSNKIIKSIYRFYFKNILPVLGGIVSGDKAAYTYLPDSVEEFDQNINLISLLTNSGFREIKKYNFTFETVQVIIAQK
ncbi:MAG: bifunctional demethylmenaquinone methyltransferase/2-methoxy-6-polyprenyl-1,4-benzoquinol methylase UbiE [Ignavibacteriales bacterium]|nr:bifunctional demethylmenaquinone methyltransferase/2-methoxy-6-polyprenyl-1,4-benzoquinol methylase UbiE [Ignavibacteriales bacterium]